MSRSTTVTLAYVPFRTLLTALDALREGIPDPLDRSVFKTFSGSTQAMLLASLRALGAVDGGNRPLPILGRLADTAERKTALRETIEACYGSIVGVARSGSPRQLDQCFRDCGANGDTFDKAKSFFLQASRFAGLTLSPHIVAGRRSRSAAARRDGVECVPAPKRTSEELRRVVSLCEGGTITLSASSVDFMRLSGDEREFVYHLIDRMDAFERVASASKG